jgi:hypothetical protein
MILKYQKHIVLRVPKYYLALMEAPWRAIRCYAACLWSTRE